MPLRARLTFVCLTTSIASACSGSATAESTDDSSSASSDTVTSSSEAGSSSETQSESSSEETGSPSDNPYEGYVSEIYDELDVWLCHPDKDDADDVCDRNLDLTSVDEQANPTLVEHQAAADPGFDCFYVYPTASTDGMANSDLIPGEEEEFITFAQAARYNEVCRVFAPVHRQVTIGSLFNPSLPFDGETAYADVLDAFKHYVANHQGDRGVLLIGHSQGAGHLRTLIAEEIETHPYLLDRLVGAHLIGNTIAVPEGEVVGGSFQSVPLCTANDQAGCVVTYASFRETEPPLPGESFFGATGQPGTVAGCTNPAALAGGEAVLDGNSPTQFGGIFGMIIGVNPGPYADPDMHDPIDTPFYATPGLVSGECVTQDGFDYLEVRINADPDDPRADDIGGDFTDGWGLHLADINLAQADLVKLAAQQFSAWSGG